MHGILKTKNTNEFKWVVGFDTGMSAGSYFIVYFEELKSNRKLSRCFYFDENTEETVNQFIRQLKSDPIYREKSFAEGERWCHISRWYEKNSWAIFAHHPLRNNNKHEELFHNLFHGIKNNIDTLVTTSKYVTIENNSKADIIDDDICDIIERLNGIKGVVTQFSCRGAWHFIKSPFNNSKLFIPTEQHMPYAHVSFNEIPANIKELLLELIPGSVFHGNFFRPMSVFNNRNFIKSLRKALLKIESMPNLGETIDLFR